jgi:hypothetical protein
MRIRLCLVIWKDVSLDVDRADVIGYFNTLRGHLFLCTLLWRFPLLNLAFGDYKIIKFFCIRQTISRADAPAGKLSPSTSYPVFRAKCIQLSIRTKQVGKVKRKTEGLCFNKRNLTAFRRIVCGVILRPHYIEATRNMLQNALYDRLLALQFNSKNLFTKKAGLKGG